MSKRWDMPTIPPGDESWVVKEYRLRELEQAEQDLKKANALIERLRAENQVLKDEKRRFFEVVQNTKRHISVAGNAQKKWAVTLVKSQLIKARLI